MKENIKKTTLPASPTNGNMIGMYAIDLGVQNPHWQIVSKELYDKEPEHRRLIVNMEANHIGLQNVPVSDTTGSDSNSSADERSLYPEGYTQMVKIAEAAIGGDADKAKTYIHSFIEKFPNNKLSKPFYSILTGEKNPDGLQLLNNK